MTINSYKSFWGILLVICLVIASCEKVNVFEKNTAIPGHKWAYNFKPEAEFTISDTSSLYNLYVVLRHTDSYGYNNIWLNIGSQSPADTMRYQRFDLQLGSDKTGWEGTGMDDIWEIRKSVTNGPFKFNKTGIYKFSIAQVMRENPLPEIMTVGIRVEKVK